MAAIGLICVKSVCGCVCVCLSSCLGSCATHFAYISRSCPDHASTSLVDYPTRRTFAPKTERHLDTPAWRSHARLRAPSSPVGTTTTHLILSEKVGSDTKHTHRSELQSHTTTVSPLEMFFFLRMRTIFICMCTYIYRMYTFSVGYMYFGTRKALHLTYDITDVVQYHVSLWTGFVFGNVLGLI